MKVLYVLVSVVAVWINPTHSQIFYSHYSPVFPQPLFPVAAPLAYNPPPSPVRTHSSVTYNLPSIPSPEYRGFGYRTDYKDGSTSTVFYVTGAEAQNLLNFKDFPNFTRRTQETAGKARSLASDITDTNAIPDAEGQIQNVLKPHEFDRLFDNIQTGLVNFYSYPAGTAPLSVGTANATTTTPSTNSEETVAAESVINAKVVVNEVENIIKTNGSDITSTSTTTERNDSSTSESSSSTTQNATETSDETVEATTTNEEN